jgi:hypothetical protein
MAGEVEAATATGATKGSGTVGDVPSDCACGHERSSDLLKKGGRPSVGGQSPPDEDALCRTMARVASEPMPNSRAEAGGSGQRRERRNRSSKHVPRRAGSARASVDRTGRSRGGRTASKRRSRLPRPERDRSADGERRQRHLRLGMIRLGRQAAAEEEPKG